MILMLISLYDVNSSNWTIKPMDHGLDGQVVFHLFLPTIRSELQHCGAYRDRTDDILNANQALSQLS